MSHSEPVLIVSNNEHFWERQCSVKEDFHELEKFWDEEKQRLSEVDGLKPAANSWEERLLNDDVLSEPSSKTRTKDEILVIKGESAKDLPTYYVASGFEPHEMIAIGTYVDKNIIPGFRYKVRKNLSDDYFFDGKALSLESVGLGYGKRITFQGATLNDNQNYFWSDTRDHGFGFTLQTLSSDDAFVIKKSDGQTGRVVIKNPALTPDVELNTVVKSDGKIEKLVRLHFSCNVSFGGLNAENVEANGMALVVRHAPSEVAVVEKIVLENFVVDGCRLLPKD